MLMLAVRPIAGVNTDFYSITQLSIFYLLLSYVKLRPPNLEPVLQSSSWFFFDRLTLRTVVSTCVHLLRPLTMKFLFILKVSSMRT